MNFSKLLTAVLAAICILGLCASAQAMTIRNMSAGTVVFHDDFEGVSPVSNAAYPDPLGDFDPVATVGTWSLITELQTDAVTEKPENVQVTDYSSPGAFEGDNYLRMAIAATAEWSYVEGDFSAVQSTSGNHIHMEFMAMLAASSKTLFYIRSSDGAARMYLYKNGNQLRSYRPGGYDVPSVVVTPGVWQKWEFDYTIGATTWTLSIDDVSSNPLRTADDLGGDLADFYIRQSSAHQSYFDAVPEPSTVVLLAAAGLLGCVCALRRKLGS